MRQMGKAFALTLLFSLVCAGLAACAHDEGATVPPQDEQAPAADTGDPTDSFSPEELLEVGKGYNARGESEKAVRVLEKAVARKADWAPALYQLGLALSRLERIPEATEVLGKAHALAPEHLETSLLLGMALDLGGKPAEALKVYQAAVKRHPENVELLHEMGVTLLMLNKVPDGIEALVRAVKLKPDDADLLGDLGYAFMVAGKHPQAERPCAAH